jgi:hypothetical protein
MPGPTSASTGTTGTGQTSDGETLRVSLGPRRQFTKLLVSVYIHEGAADFRTLGGIVIVSALSGTWRIHLDDSPAGAASYAIALLTPGRGTLDLQREVRWFTARPWAMNQQLIDQAYGFGFEWVPGVKPLCERAVRLMTRAAVELRPDRDGGRVLYGRRSYIFIVAEGAAVAEVPGRALGAVAHQRPRSRADEAP